MDGIFGVGLPEMLIIALVMFIVGGPQNSAKWAREAGRLMRKVRQSWEQLMLEVEQELGPEGKELVDATRELSRSAYELRTMSSPHRLASEAVRRAEPSAPSAAPEKAAPESSKASTEAGDQKKYSAWLPPDTP